MQAILLKILLSHKIVKEISILYRIVKIWKVQMPTDVVAQLS